MTDPIDENVADGEAPDEVQPEDVQADDAQPIEAAEGAVSDEAPVEAAEAAVSDEAPLEGAEAAVSDETPVEAAATAEPTDPEDAQDAEEQAPGAAPFQLEEWVYAAIESMAFSSAEPLTPRRAKEILVAELKMAAHEMNAEGPPPLPTIQDIKKVFRTLLSRWSDAARPLAQGFRLMELDGGITFRTAAMSARYVRRVQTERPPRLSRAALETLAVVAYRQPATKPQVEEVRGVDSGGALKALLDKKLIRVIGKADDIGRPLLYGTTKTFLEFFQLSSLSELPTLKELHELENGPTEPIVEDDQPLQAAVVMDLFNPDRPGLVSEETEQESAEALDALEQALTEAKDVAKKASTVVWGVTVDDDDAPRVPGGANGSERGDIDAVAQEATENTGPVPGAEPPALADEEKVPSEG